MPRNGISLETEAKLERDGVYGTFAWIQQQPGVTPYVMEKVLAVARHSLKLGILITVLNADKFNDGIEEEIEEETNEEQNR